MKIIKIKKMERPMKIRLMNKKYKTFNQIILKIQKIKNNKL